MLHIVLHDLSGDRSLTGVCAGYELEEWRAKHLADFLMESLPEFCLSYTETRNLDAESAVRLIRKAAGLVYQTDKFKNRGEFGELLLHVILRESMNTLPAVSKIFYKDSVNNTVKGFDAVHVVPTEAGLELWLGEVKFYNDASAAIRDVLPEVRGHLQPNYLRNEFVAIVNKIDPAWPHAEKLMRLLDENTSLDEVFDAICIPVLLTYDGEVTAEHTKTTPEYLDELVTEMRNILATFKSKAEDIPHRLHLFLLPLKTKASFIEILDGKLKAWQKL